MWSEPTTDGGPARATPRRAVWQLGFDQLLTLGTQLLVAIFLARELGPEAYGILAAFAALIGVASNIQRMGFDSIVAAEVVADQGGGRDAVATAWQSRLAAGLVLSILVLVVGLIVFEDPIVRVGIAVTPIAMLAVPLDTFRHVADTKRLARSYLPLRRAILLTVVVGNFALLLLDASLTAFLIWQASSAALLVLIPGVQALRRCVDARGGAFQHGILRRALALTVAAVAITVYLRVDMIMIALLAGAGEAGQYSAAVRVSSVPLALPAIVLSAYAQSVPRERVDESHEALDILTGAAIAWTLVVIVAAPLLIPLVFGTDFRPAVPVLQVHACSFVFLAWGAVRNRWFSAVDLEKHVAVSAVIGASLNVTLNLLLIPRYGAMGAAFATITSYAAAVIVYTLLVPSTRFFARAAARSLWTGPGALLAFLRSPGRAA